MRIVREISGQRVKTVFLSLVGGGQHQKVSQVFEQSVRLWVMIITHHCQVGLFSDERDTSFITKTLLNSPPHRLPINAKYITQGLLWLFGNLEVLKGVLITTTHQRELAIIFLKINQLLYLPGQACHQSQIDVRAQIILIEHSQQCFFKCSLKFNVNLSAVLAKKLFKSLITKLTAKAIILKQQLQFEFEEQKVQVCREHILEQDKAKEGLIYMEKY
ncbi:UNKNOWN [Stylonychia lemnae]|uniref:Uncharacterized protein n=1 Tax=Stylonychia lemnae TaxID=5949 RepID=A0A078AEP9_STYLE|nr:UNKNOWN [Stylonychia lemnae]|eukprot:CDW79957.1 UNKNOWN [Stylonychia lemnae]